MTNYYKLSDVRAALEKSLGRPVSRSLAHDYTTRKTFPTPAIDRPIRLWEAKAVNRWLKNR